MKIRQMLLTAFWRRVSGKTGFSSIGRQLKEKTAYRGADGLAGISSESTENPRGSTGKMTVMLPRGTENGKRLTSG